MKKLLPYILILIALSGIFSFVPTAQAQNPPPPTTPPPCTGGPASGCYKLLAPLPGLKTFDPTKPNNLGNYLNLMIKLFIGICAVLAVIMIVMGGIQYMTTELSHTKEAGKERIRNAIFGLLLALGAYTLLFTINPDLLNIDLSGVTQQTVEVDLGYDIPRPRPPAGQKYTNTDYKYGDPWDDSVGLIQNIPNVIKNYKECTYVGEPSGCLSTRNLNLSFLNAVKARCPTALPLRLNGGTEFWHHRTHDSGKAIIDLARSTALDTCLSGGKPLVKYRRYPDKNGPYYYEGNHWHILG